MNVLEIAKGCAGIQCDDFDGMWFTPNQREEFAVELRKKDASTIEALQAENAEIKRAAREYFRAMAIWYSNDSDKAKNAEQSLLNLIKE